MKGTQTRDFTSKFDLRCETSALARTLVLVQSPQDFGDFCPSEIWTLAKYLKHQNKEFCMRHECAGHSRWEGGNVEISENGDGVLAIHFAITWRHYGIFTDVPYTPSHSAVVLKDELYSGLFKIRIRCGTWFKIRCGPWNCMLLSALAQRSEKKCQGAKKPNRLRLNGIE